MRSMGSMTMMIMTATLLASGCSRVDLEADRAGSEKPDSGEKSDNNGSCSEITDEQQCKDRSDCQRDQGVCLHYCLPEDVGCCEFLGCEDATAPPPPPPPPPPPVACSEITDEQQCKDRSDCQRDQGVCLHYCLPEDVGCCEFLGCEDATAPPPPPPDCRYMDVADDGLCPMFLGYYWNGMACLGISGCSCTGADCGKLFDTLEACEQYYAGCIDCSGAWIDTASDGGCYGPNDGALPDSCCDALRQAACEQTSDQYLQAVVAAKSCSPHVTAPQCTHMIADRLICPCGGTFVNSVVPGLQSALDIWQLLRCEATGGIKAWWSCPPVACDPPSSGLCQMDGTCADQAAP